MLANFGEWALRNKLTLWLSFMTVIPVATVMPHASFASLAAITGTMGMMFVMRFIAHLEGRALYARHAGGHHVVGR